MGHSAPFVLLDDARPASAAADALLYEAPAEVFRASHPEEVEAVLAAAEAALRGAGGAAALAGYIAY
ncbi:MAG: aminodeoxychorismate synthase, component I, partial [Erythrobacter cryptus]